MKFSSSEYPSQKSSNNMNPTNTNDNHKTKVKIPNYTTPVYNASKNYNETRVFEGMPPSPNNRMPISPNMPNNRMPAAPNMPNNRMPSTPNMPNYRMPAAPNMPNNRTPNNFESYDDWYDYNVPDNQNNMYEPYNSMYPHPVGVPLMPLYGYDNSEDAEKDWEYFRQLCPSTAKRILREIDEECDKLEYDGSSMFDEYPDRVYLGKMVNRIYSKMKDEIEEPLVYSESIKTSYTCNLEDHESESEDTEEIQTSEFQRDSGRRGSNKRGNNRPPVRSNNWLKDLIEILLYQEMVNRRRRYRSRRRWF